MCVFKYLSKDKMLLLKIVSISDKQSFSSKHILCSIILLKNILSNSSSFFIVYSKRFLFLASFKIFKYIFSIFFSKNLQYEKHA